MNLNHSRKKTKKKTLKFIKQSKRMKISFMFGFMFVLAVVSASPLIIEETTLKVVETIDEPKCTSTIQDLR